MGLPMGQIDTADGEQEQEKGLQSAPDRFPTRPEGEQTLTGMVLRWAAATPGQEPPTLRSREDTYRHVLFVGQRQLDLRSTGWRTFACTVLREFHEDLAGEPLGGDSRRGQMRANKLLLRLVALYGALNALRLVAEALGRGAGLGDGYEDDCLSVLKYASAIGRGERAGDWRRR